MYDINRPRQVQEISGGHPRPMNVLRLCKTPTHSHLLISGGTEGQAKIWVRISPAFLRRLLTSGPARERSVGPKILQALGPNHIHRVLSRHSEPLPRWSRQRFYTALRHAKSSQSHGSSVGSPREQASHRLEMERRRREGLVGQCRCR